MSECGDFAINARFLTQRSTGVQRYGWNVLHAIDAAKAGCLSSPSVLAPPDTSDPGLANIKVKNVGPLSGHAWEQLTLPMRWAGPLLNLCNTAPVVRREQIVCIHDVNCFVSPQSYTRAFRTLYSVLQPLLAGRSAHIATVSHASARQIARHLPIRVEDIAVLPNGHEHAKSWDPTLARIAPDVIGKRSDTGRPFVLALGSRARHKNLALLIAVAAELDTLGIDIVVAGGDADIFSAEGFEVRRNVYLTGRVTDEDLAYLIDRALCLGFPSITEGFGLPIVEAMARGCPVISSNSASMPEVCGNAALLASPTNPGAWVAHVQSLRGSAGLRDELIGRGLAQVRRFSWSETAAGYMDLMERSTKRHATAPATGKLPNVSVVVATRGRPAIVEATIRHLVATQTRQPDAVIISCTDIDDAGNLMASPGVTVVTGPAGLAAQRNTALRMLPASTEIVVFFDDDFVASPNWLETAALIFRDEAEVIGLTGHVIADGILGAGIGFDEAVRCLRGPSPADEAWLEPFSPYGCNMAFRVAAIGDTRFDERLVLYAWLEDRDFAATLAKKGGRFVKSSEISGVHMGIKTGRVSGVRLGYSQIANPLYMLRKGTMTFTQVAGQVSRNMMSNFGRVFRPEPFIDRRGRVRGNLIAFADLAQGRLLPERAASLSGIVGTKRKESEVKTP